MITPSFPPLFTGRDANGNDPFALACATAEAGCDAGLVIYDLAPNTLRAAIVFAPDVSLARGLVRCVTVSLRSNSSLRDLSR